MSCFYQSRKIQYEKNNNITTAYVNKHFYHVYMKLDKV